MFTLMYNTSEKEGDGMNNHGWGLGIMLMCLAAVAICLTASALLIGKLEKTNHTKLVSRNNTINVINASK